MRLAPLVPELLRGQTIPAPGVAPSCTVGSRASSDLARPACPELVAGNLSTY
jgi:hypothetical protein